MVFTQDSGAPYGPKQVQKAFKAILALAGLPDMRFHDLRHTAATHMLVNGIDLLIVYRCLVYSSADITLDTCVHMFHSAQENAAAIKDEITTAVSWSADLVAPQRAIAPQLHQKPE